MNIERAECIASMLANINRKKSEINLLQHQIDSVQGGINAEIRVHFTKGKTEMGIYSCRRLDLHTDTVLAVLEREMCVLRDELSAMMNQLEAA